MAALSVTKAQAQEAKDALIAAHGVKSYAADRLGLNRSTYQNRLMACTRYGIEIPLPHAPELAKRTAPEDRQERNLIEELRQKVKALTETNKHLSEQVNDTEQLKAFIHECKQYRPTPPKWRASAPSKSSTGTPVLIASDWHWGETVEAAQLNGVNAFNQTIASARCQRFFSKAVELLTRHMANPQYDQMIVPLLGDMLSGNIHEELAETNWAPVNVCIMDLADHLIAGFDLLLQHFGKIYVPCVVGNHGRLHKKPRFKNKQYDNFEWVLYHILARHYRQDDRIHFDISDSPNLPFQVYNTRFLANHGDEFRGGGGVSGSWSPIIRGNVRKKNQVMAINKPYDLLLIGHWHFLQRLPGVRCNGSLKGWDEYASSNGFDFQLPTQDLFICHPVYGVTAEWQVYLETPGTTFDLRTNTQKDAA